MLKAFWSVSRIGCADIWRNKVPCIRSKWGDAVWLLGASCRLWPVAAGPPKSKKTRSRSRLEKRIGQGQPWLNEMATAIYGSYLFDRDSFLAAYVRHDTEVRGFFEGAENFMTYNVTAGDGWEPLCAFLSKPVPQAPFPRSNPGRREAS